MATCQNGWPVVERSACVPLVVHGVEFVGGVLPGDVHTVLGWVADQWHRRVMPLRSPGCWGYDKKRIEGSDEWSCHAGGTATDHDAPQLPMGQAPSAHMSAHQISECHAIERDSNGTVRWGGDFGRPDPMHWEIVGSRAAVAAFARELTAPAPVHHPVPTTMGELMKDLPTLKQGSTGPMVVRAQGLANMAGGAGSDITLDGDYGPATVAKIKRVQSASHLGPTGVVDLGTWAALLGLL